MTTGDMIVFRTTIITVINVSHGDYGAGGLQVLYEKASNFRFRRNCTFLCEKRGELTRPCKFFSCRKKF
jgi:hypothetical protein